MPGMSGLELQAQLSALGIKIPIIFITAHMDEVASRTAIDGGAICFLLKPFDDSALLAAVRCAMAQSASRANLADDGGKPA